MSGHPTITYLLVGVLLGCPVSCLSHPARGPAVETHALSCSCCPSEPSDRQPADEDSSDGQKDCLCRGAVVDAPARVADHYVESAVVRSLEAANPLIVTAAARQRLAAGFPPLSSGRKVRVLLASFLL